jgi:hypothetical protein
VDDVERVQVTECEADLTDVDASLLRRERAMRLEECKEVASAYGWHAKAGDLGRKERAHKANEVDVGHSRCHREHAPLIEHTLGELGLAANVGAVVSLGHEEVIVGVPPRSEDGAGRG